MPDITLPNTFVADATTAAADVAENLFKPRSTPDNLEVLNRLDSTNFADTPAIVREMVRPGQYFSGGTTGHTANRDYFREAYPTGWAPLEMDEAGANATPVAGLCKTHRVDFVPSLFMVCWQFGVIIDDESFWTEDVSWGSFFGPARGMGGHDTSIHLYINGVRMDRANYFLMHSERTMAQLDPLANILAGAAVDDLADPVPAKAYAQDSRWVSGHFLVDGPHAATFGFGASDTPLAAGLHTAEIRVASKVRMVRFKTSNMSIVAMR